MIHEYEYQSTLPATIGFTGHIRHFRRDSFKEKNRSKFGSQKQICIKNYTKYLNVGHKLYHIACV